MSNPIVEARKALNAAERLRVSGRYKDARVILLKTVENHPEYFAALHSLGLTEWSLGNKHSAYAALSRAHAVNPESSTTITALAAVSLDIGMKRAAKKFAELTLKIDSIDPRGIFTFGEILKEEREYELAKKEYEKCLRLDPNWREAQLSYSIILDHIGETEKAARQIAKIVKKEKTDIEALLLLSNMVDPKNHLGSGFDYFNEIINLKETANKHFALANIYGRSRDFKKSAHHIVEANKIKGGELKEKIIDNNKYQQESLEYAMRIDHITKPVKKNDLPISLFILGPSRSGKTTLEQIIGRSPSVKLGYENPSAIAALTNAFIDSGYIAATQYNMLPPMMDELCRDHYTREIKRRVQTEQVFTNTTPARIHDALSMYRVLPNVKFVMIKRSIADTAIRIHQKNYASGNFYSLTIESAILHVKWYNTMIDLISTKLADSCLVVTYENIITNADSVIKDIENFLSLDLQIKEYKTGYNDIGIGRHYVDYFPALNGLD